MMTKVAMCADFVSQRYPETIGLKGEDLSAQAWLKLFANAGEMRESLHGDDSISEAWVVSAEDIDPINLAAALKRDNPSLPVYLLAPQGTGSLYSRAKAAGIDAALSHQALLDRYAAAKKHHREVIPSTMETSPLGIASMGAAAAAHGERSSKSAFLMPVVSGSGGAGKSTVSALVALVAARRGHKVLALDFDLQFGDLRELLGQPKALGIDELLASPKRLRELKPQKGLPALLAAPRRLEKSELIEGQVPALIDLLAPSFDVIVANTGSSWSEGHAALLERASKALFLVDQRSSSLRACKHAMELCARCGIATNAMVFVANRCTKGALFTSIDLSCAMKGAPAIELKDGGVEVEEAMGAGLAAELASVKNDLFVSLDAAMETLLPSMTSTISEPDNQRKPRGLFGRRRRKKANDVAC